MLPEDVSHFVRNDDCALVIEDWKSRLSTVIFAQFGPRGKFPGQDEARIGDGDSRVEWVAL